MKQINSTHSLRKSFNRSYSNMRYKVKSVYADYFRGRKNSIRSSIRQSVAVGGRRLKKKAKKKRLKKRCGTIANFTKHSSANSFHDLKRQFTIDNPGLFNPILKTRDMKTSVEGFSKSAVSVKFDA